ncbi:MAG: hypothetical protein QOE10_435, partial [Gaiellales bacterium]|nr:hypothetical protein [Gaiellales bacterium]
MSSSELDRLSCDSELIDDGRDLSWDSQW